MILAMQLLALELISFIVPINWILGVMTSPGRPNGTNIIFLRAKHLWALLGHP
jgi:hypothetical protein